MSWFILAFISAVFSATASISEKKVLFNLGALEFSFLLALINLIFSIPFFFGINFAAVSYLSIIVMYFKTILGTLAFLCVMLALKNLEISKALPLLVLTPGLVAIFAFIFLGETLSSIEVTGMLLLLSGTYLLETKARQGILDPFRVFVKSKSYHYVIFALLLFTTTSVLDKLLLSRYKLEPVAFMGFQQLFLAINFAIIFFIFGRKSGGIKKLAGSGTLKWIIFVSALTILYRYAQIEAVKLAPVALVLSIKRVSVFFASVGGGKIFNEEDLLKKSIATAAMVAGAIMIV